MHEKETDNNKGERLMNICQQYELRILNGLKTYMSTPGISIQEVDNL